MSLITSVRELLARGESTRARQALEAVPVERDGCLPVRIVQLAVIGWSDARAAAPFGGAPERLAPVRATLAALQDLRAQTTMPQPHILEVEYAHALVSAAAAAAQDERPEMELLLGHAADLAQRLQQRGHRAEWPRPYHVASGELWFEVDRYAEARAAFVRAVESDDSPVALIGLARVEMRLGQTRQACATVRRAAGASAELLTAAAIDLGRCR